MVMPKGADDFTVKINEALASVRNKGTYQQIHDKWLAVD